MSNGYILVEQLPSSLNCNTIVVVKFICSVFVDISLDVVVQHTYLYNNILIIVRCNWICFQSPPSNPRRNGVLASASLRYSLDEILVNSRCRKMVSRKADYVFSHWLPVTLFMKDIFESLFAKITTIIAVYTIKSKETILRFILLNCKMTNFEETENENWWVWRSK